MSVRVITGDARTALAAVPAGSVQTCVTSPPYFGLRAYLPAGHPDKKLEIGAEATPDDYVAALVAVFREVRRVLRDDGTLWLNIGDSYNADARKGRAHMGTGKNAGFSAWVNRTAVGTKPKDLLMIPAMVALALRADGWWLRSEIIWHKPNPMPESVRDRPTSAHEKVFLLAKSDGYFYDAHAISEDAEMKPQRRDRIAGKGNPDRAAKDNGSPTCRSVRAEPALDGNGRRNSRNVWTISTRPSPIAHFAMMPPELAERCIKAGSSERGQCARCGTPWRRVLGEVVRIGGRGAGNGFRRDARVSYADADGARGDETPWVPKARETMGWQQTCPCDEGPPVPQIVLDPFGGAGTTALVADRLGRDAVICELSADHAVAARERITGDAPLFAV